MKTIEEIENLLAKSYLKYAIDFVRMSQPEELHYAKDFLSIVIGEVEEKCKECGGRGKLECDDQSEWLNCTQYYKCPQCKGTGNSKIKHPITIRDAIEYERKEVKP